jgi:hypothetical protein
MSNTRFIINDNPSEELKSDGITKTMEYWVLDEKGNKKKFNGTALYKMNNTWYQYDEISDKYIPIG